MLNLRAVDDMAARHRANQGAIQIIQVQELKNKDCKRPNVKQLHVCHTPPLPYYTSSQTLRVFINFKYLIIVLMLLFSLSLSAGPQPQVPPSSPLHPPRCCHERQGIHLQENQAHSLVIVLCSVVLLASCGR